MFLWQFKTRNKSNSNKTAHMPEFKGKVRLKVRWLISVYVIYQRKQNIGKWSNILAAPEMFFTQFCEPIKFTDFSDKKYRSCPGSIL